MNLTIILMIIVACLVLVFTVQNVDAVTVSIFFWDISFSLALLIFRPISKTANNSLGIWFFIPIHIILVRLR
jgi:predicted membrane protein